MVNFRLYDVRSRGHGKSHANRATLSAAVFSSDLVKEHSSYPVGGLAACQVDNSYTNYQPKISREYTAVVSQEMLHANIQRALLAAAESIIYADPARRFPERCWSKLMISPPERCPVCVKHLLAHNGVLATIKLAMNITIY